MVSAQKKAEANEPKAKRKVLSPAEKIAKLEADLKAAREKAHDSDRKVVAKATEARTKLVARRDALNEKIADLDNRIAVAEAAIGGPVTDGVGEADSDS